MNPDAEIVTNLPSFVQKSLNFSAPLQTSSELEMDYKDKQILKILKNDGRAGYGAIGKKVGLSEGAVRKRIKTLADAGVIRKFTVKIGVAEGAEAAPGIRGILL